MYDINDTNIIVDFECPICFEILNQNNIILLDCCNKTCHSSCLVTWYKNNTHNKTCFICNRENTFRNSLFTSNNIIQHNYNFLNYYLLFKIVLYVSIIGILCIIIIYTVSNFE